VIRHRLNGTSAGGLMILLGCCLLAVTLAHFLLRLDLREDGSQGSTITAATSEVEATGGVIAFWEERVRTSPGDFTALNKLAAAYMRRARVTGDLADFSRAQAALDASLASLPTENATALALQASLFATRHEFQEALATARQAIALDPGDPFARGIMGDTQLAIGLYDEAFSTYLDLVLDSPGLTSFSRLAHIYELRGELQEAEAAWQNAFSTDGGKRAENTAWARVEHGNFLFAQGNTDEAKTEYESALKVLPGYIHGLAGIARVAAADRDWERAIEIYSEVVARQPVLGYVTALGDVHRAAGHVTEAQRQYDLVAAIERLYRVNGINTGLEMALFLANHDLRLDEAVSQAMSVYDEQPQSIRSADVLSWALYKTGRYEEAAVYSQQALRLGTQDPALLFHAGMINYKLGNRGLARDYLSRAVDANPRFSVLYSDEAANVLDDLHTAVKESR
jgi:tetratricopeptide (TPR) repeat protein